MPEARHCSLFTWVPGPDLADRLTPENVYKLGHFSARLHDHALGFSLPQGARLRKLDRVFPYSVPGFRYIEPVQIFEPQFAHLFSAQDSRLYRQAVERIQAAHDRLYADPSGMRVIHYDLHHWNVKLHRGRIYALDFEDLMWGYPVQDIAITLYYWQAHSQRAALFDAFRRGYTSQAEWPESYPGEIDAFMAGRGIMLVNYLLCSREIEDQEMTPAFIERVAERLRAFLDTDEATI
jgi:Ser/Thr protein kinase RdoA (MazF antagonist)